MTGKGLRYVLVLFGLILILAALWSLNDFKLPRKSAPQDRELLHARIVFSDNESITGYVSGLGIEEDGMLYAGGSSSNYVYDKEGRVVGAFNYQRLLYIELLDDEGRPIYSQDHSPEGGPDTLN